MTPSLRFTLEDAQSAGDEWRFNCGPSAVCAVLNLTPTEIRPKLASFERKGYTNPSLMLEILSNCCAPHTVVYRGDEPGTPIPSVSLGLVRVQWSGPWTKLGVPMRSRYRHTHWIAARNRTSQVFDINAMCVGGWLPYEEWYSQLVPWLLRGCCPNADGGWWPTHAIEIDMTNYPCKHRTAVLRTSASGNESWYFCSACGAEW